MQRLPEFEHDVIGDVDECRNRTDGAALKATLHPFRGRRLGVDALEDATEIQRASIRCIEDDGTLIGNASRNFLHIHKPGLGTGNGSHFARHTGQRQTIGTIRRQLEFELLIVEIEILADGLTNRRVSRQHQKTGSLFGNTEFLGRAEHAGRLDTAHLGNFDNEIAGQLGTGQSARHAQTDGDIGRAADDGRRLTTAGIDLADIQTIGIGVLDDFKHLRDDNVVELGRDRLQAFDFKAGHGQQMGKLLARQLGVDKGTQPGFGEFHANCLRKRRSPSKKRRRSLTP